MMTIDDETTSSTSSILTSEMYLDFVNSIPKDTIIKNVPKITSVRINMDIKELMQHLKIEETEAKMIYGIPIQKSNIVPKKEMWLFDQYGNVIKRFVFPTLSQS